MIQTRPALLNNFTKTCRSNCVWLKFLLHTTAPRKLRTAQSLSSPEPRPLVWPVIAAWKQKCDWRCASLLQRCALSFFLAHVMEWRMIAANRPWSRRDSNCSGSWRHRIGLKCDDYRLLRCFQRPEGSAKAAGSFIKHQLRWCSTPPVLTVTPSDRFPTLLLGDSRDGSKRIKRLNPHLNHSTLLWDDATPTQERAEHLQPSL